MEYVLGIDIGTSGTKTVLFDKDANVIASHTIEYPMYQPHNGWAEQKPEDWWNAVAGTCKEVVSKSGVAAKDIKGIGLSGQMHGLVMLDKDNQVIRPSIIWCDQRTAKECEEIEARVGRERLIEITANPALTGFTASKIMWVKNNEPENYAKCAHILLPKDYIRFMLTGKYATEVSDASGMQLLDVPKRDWSDEVLERLGIDKTLLGKVYESPEVTGTVTDEAAALTGLNPGTKVVGGAGDNAAAAVGTGVVKDGRAFTTIGTSGVVFAHTSKISIDPKGRVHTFCCAVPGAWHVMGVTQGAGLSLQWTRNNICTEEMKQAKAEGVDPYYIMDKEADSVAIGSERLLYLPYLMGERTPHLDPNARGTFFGLSAMHKRPHIIRSVMEGVSFSLMDCLSVFGEMDIKVDSMIACGGGGTSKVWRKMLSDIYNCEISTIDSKEGPALGVAILAMVGTGMYSSVEEACDAVIRKGTTTAPDADNHERYMKFYDIYRKLYISNKENFAKLAGL